MFDLIANQVEEKNTDHQKNSQQIKEIGGIVYGKAGNSPNQREARKIVSLRNSLEKSHL